MLELKVSKYHWHLNGSEPLAMGHERSKKLRSSSLKNGTAVVRRQARSDLGCSTLES
ncbi:hypothetical protein TSUD_266090 [Trifolium subterraneum]|uniref:Uncharacterized protein n=1 Tax=Trifolium subterraneum TaxID=3900 RepID=A0A2Z6MK99_TRISU|nr:hypothetical protein TSUD_266090 [Trifolium subterraneum]